MTFTVKVKDIDTSLLGSGGRTLSIKPRHKPNFTTPTYPFSKPDFTAKSYLGFRGVFNGNLGVIPIDIRGQRYVKFSHNNGTVKYIRRTITKFSDKMCFNENFTVLDVNPENPTNQKIQKLYLEMQLIVKYLNYISIPPIQTTNMNQFKHVVTDWQNNAEQYEKAAIPQISLSEDLDIFKQKLDVLCELAQSDVIDAINLKYANPRDYPHQFVAVWEKRETDVLFNCYGAPRKGRIISLNFRESPILGLQRYGIDTITYLTKTPSQKYVASLQFKEAPKSVDALDYDWVYYPGGAVLEHNYWRSLPAHSVNCPCKVCKNRVQSEIINEYCYNDLGEIDNSSMGYTSKLHSGLSSELEYSRIKRYIKSNEMTNYHSEVENYRNKNFVT